PIMTGPERHRGRDGVPSDGGQRHGDATGRGRGGRRPDPRVVADGVEDAAIRATDVRTWSDARLVAAVRRDPPDDAALDALAQRHWKVLYGRCRLLTGDTHAANDLAQETWYRVLRVRNAL